MNSLVATNSIRGGVCILWALYGSDRSLAKDVSSSTSTYQAKAMELVHCVTDLKGREEERERCWLAIHPCSIRS